MVEAMATFTEIRLYLENQDYQVNHPHLAFRM